jgi:hypothetical protein
VSWLHRRKPTPDSSAIDNCERGIKPCARHDAISYVIAVVDARDDYLTRLRAVERVLEGGFHDPAKFVARIRGAIGVLPE